jgi:A/G-specific adenine glycosylase
MSASFASRLLDWFDREGRHDLPWQHPRTPYRVWLAEVMLQQTQVTTVIPYFERFLARFPDWRSLADAPPDDVLARWAGLGYYARARNLHRAARIVVDEHGGEMPPELDAVMELPGLGRSTAAAILSQAYGQRHAILDGNVKRVLARHAAVDGWPGLPAVQRRLWQEAESRLPEDRFADYTQAIMDLGATLCLARQPQCQRCPVSADCVAFQCGETARFPAARPRRERPHRRSTALIVENEAQAILFERRPPAGIWGGLWCLPLFDADEDWREGLRARYGLDGELVARREVIQHGFTHFDLDLEPLVVRAQGTVPAVFEQSDRRWIRLADDELPGVPAPIRKLLDL